MGKTINCILYGGPAHGGASNVISDSIKELHIPVDCSPGLKLVEDDTELYPFTLRDTSFRVARYTNLGYIDGVLSFEFIGFER